MERGHYVIETDYFNEPWTWTKRCMEFFVVFLFFLWLNSLESEERETAYSWVKYVLFGLLTIYIFARPKDDFAMDNDSLYYIKKSILPIFSRRVRYRLSGIKSISGGGIFEGSTEIFGLLGFGTNRNRIEITFKDNSSRILDITIYRRDIEVIISTVRERINQNSA